MQLDDLGVSIKSLSSLTPDFQKQQSLFYSLNQLRWTYDHLHPSSIFWDRGTRIIILYCETASSFNSKVNILNHHCIIPAAQCGLGHSLVEAERSWKIVSRSGILWVHIPHLDNLMCAHPYVTFSTSRCWSGELSDKIPEFLRTQSIGIWYASFPWGGCCLGSSLFSFVAIFK